jgi:phenylacetate-CoA ligase
MAVHAEELLEKVKVHFLELMIVLKTICKMKTIDRLKSIVAFAKNNTVFYSRRIADFDTLDSFGMIKQIRSEDILNNLPPKNYNLLTRKNLDSCYVFITGGTANKPKYIIRNIEDFEDQGKYFIPLGIGKGDRVANLFSPGMWGCFISWSKGLEKVGSFVVPLGCFVLREDAIDLALQILADLEVNTLVCVPTTAISLSLTLRKKKSPFNPKNIEKILVAGELMTDEMIREIKKTFCNAKVMSMYATTEAGGIGFQCRNCRPNEYHVYDNIYLEIDHGEIIVTNLNEKIMPLIRFNTGDKGEFIDYECGCSSINPKIRVFGRGDESFCVEGTVVPLRLIDETIAEFPALIPNYQVLIEKKNALDFVTITIEGEGDVRVIKKSLNSKVSEPLLNFSIEIVHLNRIERMHNNKIKRIVDKR